MQTIRWILWARKNSVCIKFCDDKHFIAKCDEDFCVGHHTSFHASWAGLTVLTQGRASYTFIQEGFIQAFGTRSLLHDKRDGPVVPGSKMRCTCVDDLHEAYFFQGSRTKMIKYSACVETYCHRMIADVPACESILGLLVFDHGKTSKSTKEKFVENEEYFFWGNAHSTIIPGRDSFA
jgi:hypothetical protein